jgi:hypothetical protein
MAKFTSPWFNCARAKVWYGTYQGFGIRIIDFSAALIASKVRFSCKSIWDLKQKKEEEYFGALHRDLASRYCFLFLFWIVILAIMSFTKIETIKC